MINKRFIMLPNLQIRYWIVAILVMSLLPFLSAQNEEKESVHAASADSINAEANSKTEKQELRMSFEIFNINGELLLTARVRSKVNAKFQNTAGVKIIFYKREIAPENLIAAGVSDHKGEVNLNLLADTTKTVEFLAIVHDNPDYEDVEENVTSKLSRMDLGFEEGDSSHLVKIFVGHPDETGKIVPLLDAECKIYIKRLFGLLPIGEAETTDADGNISVDFPDDLRGDTSGNLTVIAKIADNDIVGNVEVSKTISWGIPLKVDNFYLQRELWSARDNSPWTLILVVNAVLLGIWGVIAFIFLEIIRIKKLGKIS